MFAMKRKIGRKDTVDGECLPQERHDQQGVLNLQYGKFPP